MRPQYRIELLDRCSVYRPAIAAQLSGKYNAKHLREGFTLKRVCIVPASVAPSYAC